MAYYVGDTPVVIGSIYNKGPSKAKVKVGIEVEQVRNIFNGYIPTYFPAHISLLSFEKLFIGNILPEPSQL